MNWSRIFFLFGILFGVLACGGSQQSASLVGNKWVLESIKDMKYTLPNDSEAITLSFDESEKKVNGKAFCNLFFADYEVEDNSMRISSVCATRMTCPDQELELKYFQELEKVDQYKVEGSHLYLMRNKEIVITYISEKK